MRWLAKKDIGPQLIEYYEQRLIMPKLELGMSRLESVDVFNTKWNVMKTCTSKTEDKPFSSS
jgi:hypothetical protein